MTDFDRDHIWHPYTSMTDPLPTYPVKGAAGVRITLDDGRELIDGMSSWWCAIHGYNHPALNQAAKNQIDSFAHVMFGGFRHEPATRLAEKIINITPPSLQYLFFSDSGSVSVEVAMKMAIQFWQNQGHPNKHRLLTVYGGYHGDTFGAMSVTDPINGMHSLFGNAVRKQFFAPRPECRFGEPADDADLFEFRQMLEQHQDEIAAVILEPIVQGAGGMWFYSADYLRSVRQLCDEFDVLLILDEIATGFGRTGKMFASEHADIEPDIMCLGKSLTGGYASLAATLCNDKVRDGICDKDGVLMHGPTFMANPLVSSIARASIDLLGSYDWQTKVHNIEEQFRTELEPYRSHPSVNDVRVLGAIGVVEMQESVDVALAQQQFVEAGVWIRPFGKLVYLMPPFITEPEDVSQLTAAIGLLLD